MKRNSFGLIGILGAALFLFAESRLLAQNAKPPAQLTYQGFLTDGNGVPFGNTSPVNKTVIFRIYDGLTGGTIKWSSQQVVTVDKGYFSVLLGQGSAVGTEPFNADLTGLFTGPGASDRYLDLNADGTAIAPRLRFLPSPYAMLAASATQLLDPSTGNSSLSISNGNLTSSGSIAAATFSGSGVNLNSIPNSATTATSANTKSTIVARDASGNFSAGTVTATSFSGSGANLTSIPNSATTATSANTASATVARDASGNFSAGTVTAISFSGSGANLTGIPNSATSATSANTVSAIVARDSSGNVALNGLNASGLVYAQYLSVWNGSLTHGQGAWLEWNKDGGGGATYLLNQKGGGAGGIIFGEVDTANIVTERMRISSSGYLGIGTTAPSAPLEVIGTVNSSVVVSAYLNNSGAADNTKDPTQANDISIKASGIIVGSTMIVTSDARIKRITGRPAGNSALETVRKLQVTDYQYVDSIKSGLGIQRGFIAQEVEKVIPGAVTRNSGVVPDIYTLSQATRYDPSTKALSITLKAPHGLTKNEVVSLVFGDRQQDFKVTAVPSAMEFVVSAENHPATIFVYGRRVDDFRAVNYDRIFTTGIGAIQELSKLADQQAESLRRDEVRIAELEHKVSKLSALEGELAEVKKLLARLAEPHAGDRAARIVAEDGKVVANR